MAAANLIQSLRIATINIDCADAEAMAEFYGRLFGWPIAFSDDGFILMRDPSGGTGLSFQARADYRPPVWPEQSGAQEKMLHLEIKTNDLVSAVAHALECGAVLADFQGRDDLRVMLDPAGHPFCLFLT